MQQNLKTNPTTNVKRHRQRKREHRSRTKKPKLRFTPTAWAKLLFLRDYGDTEVGGFGISARHDLLLVEDVQLVKQSCTWVHVAFDDESVADYFDQQVDLGVRLENCGRIWIHTHPGDGPQPSPTDDETFERVFGNADWALMFILARGGQTYARLRFNIGPRTDIELAVSIDYSQPFEACTPDCWEQEYLNCVHPQADIRPAARGSRRDLASPVAVELVAAWDDLWCHESDPQLKGLDDL